LHQGVASSYVKYAILTVPKKKKTVMNVRKKTIKTKGRKPPLDALKFAGVS
jgi:hypothetical protein